MKQGYLSDNRIKWLDLARTIAILCVVICHINDNSYTLDIGYMTSLGLAGEVLAFTFRAIGRIGGVPLFLMLTGYLLLDRDYDERGMKAFWKDRWLHLLICTWIWIIIDRLFILAMGKGLSFTDTIRELLFLKAVDLGHAWYMPMIIGMYLLIPFVALALKKVKPSVYMPVYLILILLCFGFPFLNAVNHLAVINSLIGRELSLQISLGFSGGAYGLYMVTGYLIKNGVFKRIRTFVLWLIFAVSFLGTVIFQLLMFAGGYPYDLWYNNLLVFIAAVSLFELISRAGSVIAYPVFGFIAYYAFAVYLVHNLVLLVLFRLLRSSGIEMGHFLTHIVMLVAVTGITLLIVWAVSKIPKVGKYIFFLK